MTDEKEKKQPKAKFGAGSMSTALWENTAEKDGNKFTFLTVSLQRSYKNSKGEWENPDLSLRLTDLPKAMLVLQKAYEEAMLGTKDNSEEQILTKKFLYFITFIFQHFEKMDIKKIKNIINSESKIWEDCHPEHREAIRNFARKIKVEIDIALSMEDVE